MKKKHIIYHSLFWITLMLTFAISEWSYRNTFVDALTLELLFLPAKLIVVYINWFILFPLYLSKNKPYTYALLLVLLLLVVGIIQRAFVLYIGYPIFFPEWMEGEHVHILKLPKIIQNVLIIIIPVAFTTGWILFSDLKKKQQLAKALEQQKTDAELNYLKSQINPHFLFNTLNTIYGLALDNSKKAPELILKLSDFLSFSLYESNQKLIPIEKEINLIQDFIAIEKSRFADKVSVSVSLPKVVSQIQIPPLILVPFIENAFKHSLKDETGIANIIITLNVLDNYILFTVKNSKSHSINKVVDNNSGLGLANIKKRLDIIYGLKYNLNIEESKSNFLIELKIDLK
ncbi:sensor histidine kinase [Lacinutrix chionoecetis]